MSGLIGNLPAPQKVYQLSESSPQSEVIIALREEIELLWRVIGQLNTTLAGVDTALGLSPPGISTIILRDGSRPEPAVPATIIKGKVANDGGVQVGSLCYQQGQAWRLAANDTAGAFARGVCVAKRGAECDIKTFGQVRGRCLETEIDNGSTLYLGTNGQATSTRPDPTAVVFWQEVGYTVGQVANGQANYVFMPRIEAIG